MGAFSGFSFERTNGLSLLAKLDAFIESPESWADTFDCLDVDFESSKGLVRNPTNFRHSFFERDVKLSSPVLKGGFRSFLGAYSYVGNGGYIKNSFIGRYCSIGRRVTIGAGMHAMDNLTTYPGLSQKKISDPVIIENDVWIGDGAVILPGVRVSTGSVIGANAVVTKDVSNFSVVVGSPACHIRYRIDGELHALVLGSEWWELPISVVSETKKLPLLKRIELLSKSAHSSHPIFDTYFLSE